MKLLTSRLYICLELVVFTVVIPLALMQFQMQRYIFPVMWLVVFYCLFIGRKLNWEMPKTMWRRAAITRANMRPMLALFAISAVLLTVGIYVFEPQSLFGFVKRNPLFWAVVMVLYPLLSVIAQEIIYRWFFFARYGGLFRSERIMILASAVAFGFGHVLFHNWVSPVLSLIGGIIFARTYARHRSIALVSLEHALYGNLIYTLGLGAYFFHGR